MIVGGLFDLRTAVALWPYPLISSVTYLIIKEIFRQEPCDFISFFSQDLLSHDLLPSHYFSSWALTLTLINKTERWRHSNTKPSWVLFPQLIKCISLLLLRICKSFVLCGDEPSALPFGFCSANSFTDDGKTANPSGCCCLVFFFHCSEQTSLRRSNIPSLGIFPALSALGKIIACLLFLHLACSQNQSVYSETILYAIWCSKHRLSSPLSSLNSPLQTVLWKTESHWNTSEIFSKALAFGSCFIQSQYQNEEGTCAKNTDALRWLGRERSHQFAPCSWIRCAVIKAARLVWGRQPLVLGRHYFSSRDGLSKELPDSYASIQPHCQHASFRFPSHCSQFL